MRTYVCTYLSKPRSFHLVHYYDDISRTYYYYIYIICILIVCVCIRESEEKNYIIIILLEKHRFKVGRYIIALYRK